MPRATVTLGWLLLHVSWRLDVDADTPLLPTPMPTQAWPLLLTCRSWLLPRGEQSLDSELQQLQVPQSGDPADPPPKASTALAFWSTPTMFDLERSRRGSFLAGCAVAPAACSCQPATRNPWSNDCRRGGSAPGCAAPPPRAEHGAASAASNGLGEMLCSTLCSALPRTFLCLLRARFFSCVTTTAAVASSSSAAIDTAAETADGNVREASVDADSAVSACELFGSPVADVLCSPAAVCWWEPPVVLELDRLFTTGRIS